jgi:hypothetical protein
MNNAHPTYLVGGFLAGVVVSDGVLGDLKENNSEYPQFYENGPRALTPSSSLTPVISPTL